jgi:hypothetical protein
VGNSLQFRAIALRRDGSEQVLESDVVFSSTDVARLQVSATGIARALKTGTAFVAASYSDRGRLVRDSVEVVLTELQAGPARHLPNDRTPSGPRS